MVIPVSVNVGASTFTANARFPFVDGQQVYIESRIPNQVPAPLEDYDSQQQRVLYFVIALSGGTFQLSLTLGGAAITLTAAGIGQITVSEYPPLPWESLLLLPLVQVSDIRTRFTTPEALVNETAAPNQSIGLTISGNVFTTGIEHGLVDWTPVQFAGTVPSPLVTGTTYYVRDTTPTTFTAASVIGGSAITLGGAGSNVTVSNYALDGLLLTKRDVGMEWLYDALSVKVANHMKFVGASWWYWYAPPGGEAIEPQFFPATRRAQIVLDNLLNPEKLIVAAVDYAKWAMIEDGSWRNQIVNPAFLQQFGPTPESTAKKRAEERLQRQSQLLLVSGYQGARRLFDFDQVTDSLNISLV